MIKFVKPSNGGEPLYYIINNINEASINTTYNDLEMFKEEINIEGCIYGRHNITYGNIEDITCYVLIDEVEHIKGAESKANNKGKIL